MQFFKRVLSTRKDSPWKEHETVTANLKQDYKGANRVEIERTVFGPRGGKSLHWTIYLDPEDLHAISDALRQSKSRTGQ